MEKTTATLVRRTALTETSLIVHWCSKECGLIKTVAKGARRPGSPFAGKLDLFYEAEIELVRSRKSDLHTLKDLAILKSRLGLRQSYVQTLAASYFVKLLDLVAEPETPIMDLWDLLNRALDYLDKSPADLRALLHFEKELTRLLGLTEEGRPPVNCIADTFGQIPRQREELIGRLA